MAALSDDILHSVLKRNGKNLLSLDLSSTPKFLTEFGLEIIGLLNTISLIQQSVVCVCVYVHMCVGMYCSCLERLDLSGVSVTQNAFRKLSLKCTNLKVSIQAMHERKG